MSSNFLIKIIFLSLICVNLCKFRISTDEIEKNYVSLFEKFLIKYNKLNKYDSINFEKRLQIFKENLYKIKMYQDLDQSGIYAITEFSDLTEDEFRLQYLNLRDLPIEKINGFDKVIEVETNSLNFLSDDLPTSFDWREKGVVTAVKQQGYCGSCWTFSATQAIESHYAIKYNNLLTLSEQQIVDCDDKGYGCSGGYHFEAFDYVRRQGGILREEDYPYTAHHNKTCNFDESKVAVKVKGYVNVTSDENEIARAIVENGPISVGLDGRHWQYYWGGISNPWLCTNAMNHAVLIVGYGEHRGIPYWIIKNSWGEKWGEKGYVRLIRGKNKCGVQRAPSYPLIE